MKNFTEHKNENFRGKCFAFTMAEILISLTIIGIIAAIIIPSLHANIEKRAWNAKKRALYSRLSQAIDMMPKIAGYGTYSGEWSDGSVSVTADTAAMAFVTDGLSKVMKINNICDNNNFDKCGLPSKITTMTNTKLEFPTNLYTLQPAFASPQNGWHPYSPINTESVAFETVNGDSIAVFYNPNCEGNRKERRIDNSPMFFAQHKICAHFIYDINGKKGPNTFGKDISTITVIYPELPIVINSPNLLPARPAQPPVRYTTAKSACKIQDSNGSVPNLYELMTMFVNSNYFSSGCTNPCNLVSRDIMPQSNDFAYMVAKYTGAVNGLHINSDIFLHCIKH